MDKKNNQSKIQNLSSLPLEQLTEEQISELMLKLSTLKQQKQQEGEQKQEENTETDTGIRSSADAEMQPPDEDGNPPLIYPDPSCFDEPDRTPDEAVPAYEISGPAESEAASAADGTDIYDTRPLSSDDMDEETIAVYRNLVLKRRRQKRLLITLAAVVGVLILIIVLFAGYLTLYKPTIDNKPPSFLDPETTDSASGNAGGNNGEFPDDPVQAPAIDDTFARREDVYNFLILGIDRAANLSDVIMIVSYDVKNGDIHVLSLPRDTYINVGSNYHKLNAYFSASYNHSTSTGTERYRDAIESMAEFLQNGLCIKIDRYVCVDTAGFRDIIDAIGGVDMEVPFDMDYEDPEQELYIHLKAGYQHLNGAQAEQFVRFRSGYLNGDIGRISAQKLFLTALAAQLKNNFNAGTLITIAKTAITYVTTDLTVAEIGYFAKHALSVDMEDISFTTLPGGGVTNPSSGASYYVMYAENVRSLVNSRFNVYTREISRDVFLSNAVGFTSTESY
ncbi:MAG: LCP family protein, partial [Eubacteriales bacterium]